MANAAASDDSWLSALSSALDGSQPIDPFAMVKAQLEAQGDVRARLLLRILEQQRQFREASELESQPQADLVNEDDELIAGQNTAAGEPDIDLQTDVRDIQQAVDALHQDIVVLRARTQALAAATGACPVCFGEDLLCDECAGRGVPGSQRPEPGAFRKYILPAYRRALAANRARAHVTPRPRSDEQSVRTDLTATIADER